MSRIIGIKKETTAGVYVAPDTVFKDVDSTKFEASNDLQEPAGVARARTRFSPGKFVTDSGGFAEAIDARTFGQMLFAALGATELEADTPTTGATEHVFYPALNLASYSLDLGLDDLGVRRIAGAGVDRLSLTCEAGGITTADYDMPYHLDEFNNAAITSTYYGFDGTFHHGILYGFHEAALAFGTEGQDIDSHSVRHATRFTLEIGNNMNPDYVLGQRTVYKVREQGRDIGGNMDFLYEDDVGAAYDAEGEYEKFLGAAGATGPQTYLDENSISFILTSAETFTVTQAHEAKFYLPRTVYENGPPNLDGRGALVQSMTFRAYESLTAPTVTNLYDGVAYASLPDQFEIFCVMVNDIATLYDTY